MHPVIRLACLPAIALLLPWWPPQGLYLFAAALAVAAVLRPQAGRRTLLAVRRMRWLLLSIIILYGWFTPGEWLLPVLGRLSPTDTGATLALQRGLVLIAMVALVMIVVDGMRKPALAAGLIRLFAFAGSAGRRFGHRMSLMLDALPAMEQAARTTLRDSERSFAERAAALIAGIETRAGLAVPAPAMEVSSSPPRWQWLLPAGLFACGVLVIFLGEV